MSRALLASLLAAVLSICACACDTTSSLSTTDAHRRDRDNDGDNNDDDQHVLDFGHVAGASDQRAITSLVQSYFAAAAAENGRAACALLTPFVAESVPENNGHSPQLRGSTCATVMTKLFAVNHRALTRKQADMKIVRIGVGGDKALVAIEFYSIPELRQTTARRVNGRWTELHLLDGIVE